MHIVANIFDQPLQPTASIYSSAHIYLYTFFVIIQIGLA